MACIPQEESGLVFVRSERRGRMCRTARVLSCWFSVLFTVFLIQSECSLLVTALEKHPCPQSWPAERLRVLQVWRNGRWLTSLGKQSSCWCLGHPLPSCVAVSPPCRCQGQTRSRCISGASVCLSSTERLLSLKKNIWPFRQPGSSYFLFRQVRMEGP